MRRVVFQHVVKDSSLTRAHRHLTPVHECFTRERACRVVSIYVMAQGCSLRADRICLASGYTSPMALLATDVDSVLWWSCGAVPSVPL